MAEKTEHAGLSSDHAWNGFPKPEHCRRIDCEKDKGKWKPVCCWEERRGGCPCRAARHSLPLHKAQLAEGAFPAQTGLSAASMRAWYSAWTSRTGMCFCTAELERQNRSISRFPCTSASGCDFIASVKRTSLTHDVKGMACAAFQLFCLFPSGDVDEPLCGGGGVEKQLLGQGLGLQSFSPPPQLLFRFKKGSM